MQHCSDPEILEDPGRSPVTKQRTCLCSTRIAQVQRGCTMYPSASSHESHSLWLCRTDRKAGVGHKLELALLALLGLEIFTAGWYRCHPEYLWETWQWPQGTVQAGTNTNAHRTCASLLPGLTQYRSHIPSLLLEWAPSILLPRISG